MKKILMLIAGVTFTLAGYSQATPQQHAENQVQDPKRKENAGKADVISTHKKTIFDSTTFIIIDSPGAVNNKAVKAGTKKKHCAGKTKRGGTTKKKA